MRGYKVPGDIQNGTPVLTTTPPASAVGENVRMQASPTRSDRSRSTSSGSRIVRLQEPLKPVVAGLLKPNKESQPTKASLARGRLHLAC